jgi:hypothetical protein
MLRTASLETFFLCSGKYVLVDALFLGPVLGP